MILRNYIIADRGIISIVGDFGTRQIKQEDIEYIEIGVYPFYPSYFLLKDKSKIKFNGWEISSKESKKFIDIKVN